MLSKLISAGYLFEIGFKMGFLYELSLMESRFKEELLIFFEKVQKRIETEDIDFGLFKEIFKVLTVAELCSTFLLRERKEEFISLVEKKLEQRIENSNDFANLGIYVNGLYAGRFFVKNLKSNFQNFHEKLQEGNHLENKNNQINKNNQTLIKIKVCDIFEENSTPGHYMNADLIFEVGSKLYVYDFKLHGGYHILKDIFNYKTGRKSGESNIFLPLTTRGYRLYISMGNAKFENFIEHIIEIGKKLAETGELEFDLEMRTIIQIFSYALDYLSQSNEKFTELECGAIYSLSDGPRFIFDISQTSKDFLVQKAEEIKDLYKDLKRLRESYSMEITKSIEQYTQQKEGRTILAKLRSLTRKLLNEKEAIKQELEKRELESQIKKEYLKPAMGITELRSKVKEVVQNFYDNNPWGKVLVLLHSTGAGKTTSAREVFLDNNSQKIIYFYFAPRKRLLEQEKKEIETKGIQTVYIYESELNKQNKEVNFTKSGYEAAKINENQGKLKKSTLQLVNLIYTKPNNPKNNQENNQENVHSQKKHCKHLACLLTTHTITNVETARGVQSTLNEVIKAMGHFTKNGYKIVFVFDEITGSDNGFSALLSVIKEIMTKHKNDISVLVFDATLHSKGVFEKVWKEFNNNKIISSCFLMTDFEKDGTIQMLPDLSDIKGEVYSGFSYPAKDVTWEEYFIINEPNNSETFSEKSSENFSDKFYKQIVEIIAKKLRKLKQKKQRMYIYIQDREKVNQLAELLEQEGFKILKSTGTLQSPESKINDNQYDAVISTSTLSRGINLKNNFTTVAVVITHFAGLEENIAEDLQACARIRGMPNDEEVTKTIMRIYAFDGSNFTDKLLTEIVDSYIEAYLEEHKKYSEIFEEEQIKKGKIEDLKKPIKEYIKTLYWRNIYKDIKNYASLIREVYKVYLNPHDRKRVIALVTRQIAPRFMSTSISDIDRFLTFLEDFLDYSLIPEKKRIEHNVRQLIHAIKNVINALIDIPLTEEVLSREHVFPYSIVKEGYVNIKTDPKLAENIKENFVKVKPYLEKECKDNPKELESWMIGLLEQPQKEKIVTLVYMPSVALCYELLRKNDKTITINKRKYVTRFSLPIIGVKSYLQSDISAHSVINSLNRKFVSFPIREVESYNWLRGKYPKLSGEIIEILLRS